MLGSYGHVTGKILTAGYFSELDCEHDEKGGSTKVTGICSFLNDGAGLSLLGSTAASSGGQLATATGYRIFYHPLCAGDWYVGDICLDRDNLD